MKFQNGPTNASPKKPATATLGLHDVHLSGESEKGQSLKRTSASSRARSFEGWRSDRSREGRPQLRNRSIDGSRGHARSIEGYLPYRD